MLRRIAIFTYFRISYYTALQSFTINLFYEKSPFSGPPFLRLFLPHFPRLTRGTAELVGGDEEPEFTIID
jgi:hypothetical protein